MRIRFVIFVCLGFSILCVYFSIKIQQDYNHASYRGNQRQVYIKNLQDFKIHSNNDNGIFTIRENNNINLNHVENSQAVNFACASELFVSECPNAGLGAILLNTLDHLSFCETLGATPTVFWRKCVTACPKDPTINAWELYFEPVNPRVEEIAKVVLCLGSSVGPISSQLIQNMNIDNSSIFRRWEERTLEDLTNLSFRKRTVIGFKGFGVITRGVQLKANQAIQKYVKVKPQIQRLVDQFYSKYLDKFDVVAVHIRGTDHGLETDDGRLAPLSAYIQSLKDFLRNKPTINRIFVASDNAEGPKRLVEEFGNKVVYTKALRAKAYHGPAAHASGEDGFKLGSQVLVDILLMAKCKYFFHVESSVAALVTYFNPDIESYFVDNNKHFKPDFVGYANTSPVKMSKKDVLEDQKELNRDAVEGFQCFLKHRRYSVCPNFSKGKLLYLKDVLEMTNNNFY